MGGGALMTPMLVVFFNVPPLTAVSSDLVAAAVMKPVGGGVHMRKGTVNFTLVKYLAIGSVPAAFFGVLVINALGDGENVESYVQYRASGSRCSWPRSASPRRPTSTSRREPSATPAGSSSPPTTTARR